MTKLTIAEALEKVFEELSKMSSEEFRRLLDEHSNGDVAKLLENAKMYAPLERALTNGCRCNNCEASAPEGSLGPSLTCPVCNPETIQ